jgi:hypothetical protein
MISKIHEGKAMRAAEVAVVGALVHRFRELVPLLQEHLDTYAELLPHVFMGDFTRWIVDRLRHAGASDPTLRHILDFVEATFKEGGEHEQELIAVSFLENLPRPSEEGADFLELIGPALQQELIRLRMSGSGSADTL